MTLKALKLDPDTFLEDLSAGKVVSVFGNLAELRQKLPLELNQLSEEEQSRYTRFRNPEDAWAFYTGRALLRSLLGICVNEHPLEIDFSEKGKPLCLQSGAPHFNLSHGGGWLMLSFCSDAVVGVDLENLQRKVPVEALSRRYFSVSEQQQLKEGRSFDFFKIWTRKEARAKASGEGLTVSISDISTEDADWQFYEFRPDAETLGVIAYPGPARLHCLMKV